MQTRSGRFFFCRFLFLPFFPRDLVILVLSLQFTSFRNGDQLTNDFRVKIKEDLSA